ncbi:uncharacterized protein LOC110467506 [Mizuhopecten yessoensis]|uniref:Tyrosinase-like protein tyr-3 n=1 Tax=Mizuhopecten yessoensis TaxID=6573 RepID=A0A210PLP8_MIZYE|nr:uncharacterized protein LOC110467506 [Mizuhopecten yessoensis]OWF37387.1 tyrosinase-like protein tyr-3 [Mizuhopecten yessoensis]
MLYLRLFLLITLMGCLPSVIGQNFRHLRLEPWFAQCLRKFYKKFNNVENSVGLSIKNFCTFSSDWNKMRTTKLSKKYLDQHPQARTYIDSIKYKVQNETHKHRGKRQADEIRVRKEYRMLTDEERNRFHRAVYKMKNTMEGEVTRYEAFAAYHSGDTQFTAHGGCNFPGWHRIYLLMFEEALNIEEPGLGGIPYWDSTIDNELGPLARVSIMWSGAFAGNGNGTVTSGSFAGPTSENDLTRNVGGTGQLLSEEDVRNITSRTRFGEICGNAEPQYDIEFKHGPVHIFVDGQMGVIRTAALDPVFFLHHAFVDYIWEMFRENQENNNVDVEADYPTEFGDIFHAPDVRLDLEPSLYVADTLQKRFSAGYRYAPRPTCDVVRWHCNSKWLRCINHPTLGPRCVPILIGEDPTDITTTTSTSSTTSTTTTTTSTTTTTTPSTTTTTTPSTTTTARPDCPTYPPPTPHPPYNPPKRGYGVDDGLVILPTQNTFGVDGDYDTRHWMYLPVRITVRRPNDYKAYRSYPVKKGKVQRENDVYAPRSEQNKVYNYIKPGQPKRYDNCQTSKSGAGVVYVQTDGINYEGKYIEYAVVDNRLAISVALAYVAVRNPGRGIAEVLFTAYDNCGRVCHPSCLNMRTRQYERCTGAMRITNPNYMYSNESSYGESVEKVWEFGEECPQFKTDNIHVSFFCDYSQRWPWPDALKQEDIRMNVPGHMRKPSAPRPVSIHQPTLKVCKPKVSSFMSCPIRREQCNAPCVTGEKFACTNKCHLFSECQSNSIYVVRCPRSQNFNPETKKCERQYRCTVLPQKRTTESPRNRFLELARLRQLRYRQQQQRNGNTPTEPDHNHGPVTDPQPGQNRGTPRDWRNRRRNWRQRSG